MASLSSPSLLAVLLFCRDAHLSPNLELDLEVTLRCHPLRLLRMPEDNPASFQEHNTFPCPIWICASNSWSRLPSGAVCVRVLRWHRSLYKSCLLLCHPDANEPCKRPTNNQNLTKMSTHCPEYPTNVDPNRSHRRLRQDERQYTALSAEEIVSTYQGSI